VIAALRRLRFTGPEIAELLEMATSTVSAVLKRIGLGRRSRLEPPEPVRRYEKRRAGELLPIDVKKLGRIERGAGHRATGRRHYTTRHTDRDGVRRGTAGWEFVHVCVDDATRLAYAEVLENERALTAIGFLRRCLAFYRDHGVRVERVMTDNGSPYVAAVFALAWRGLGIRHCRTQPYRPQTNGKAERFIRTMLAEWAYALVYGSSDERAAALSGWLKRVQHQPKTRRPRSPTAARPANRAPGEQRGWDLQLGSRHRFEVEDLGRHVVTSIDPAHERPDLATGDLLQRADELIVARVLKEHADLAHRAGARPRVCHER
jgi:transposase InsO family protein